MRACVRLHIAKMSMKRNHALGFMYIIYISINTYIYSIYVNRYITVHEYMLVLYSTIFVLNIFKVKA